MRSQRGFSLIEVLIAFVIMTLIGSAFTSLMTSMNLENRSVSDNVERSDIERQLGSLLADDRLCGCNLAGAPAMTLDSSSPTGASGTYTVPLAKIISNCDKPDNTFAVVGAKMAALSSSFKVSKIAIRDLQPTGKRDPTTNRLNEYAGAYYIEFDPTASPRRALRPIKASKIFATDASGQNLYSCSSATNFYIGPMITNVPGVATYAASVARCPAGYTVKSGGWRTDGKMPTCPTGGDPRPPQIVENHPVTTSGGTQGWMVIGSCMTLQAIAVCQQGR